MAKAGTLSDDIMDFFKQFFEKSPDGAPENTSDFGFFDKLLKMRVSRERLGVFAALAVSTGVFFFYLGRPQPKPGRNPKTTKGILKTSCKACQTLVDGNTITVHISGPEGTQPESCCAEQEREQPCPPPANVEEQAARPSQVQPDGRHRAVLATWTSRSARPAYSVNFAGGDEGNLAVPKAGHSLVSPAWLEPAVRLIPDCLKLTPCATGVRVNGDGRKKKVTFSKSVVEPSGDNDAYRRNYHRSAAYRQGGKARRHNQADNIARNGDFSQKTDENCTNCSAPSRQPCYPDTTRNSIDDFQPQPTGEKLVSDTGKGCRHTRSADTPGTVVEGHHPLRQQDRNRIIADSSDEGFR